MPAMSSATRCPQAWVRDCSGTCVTAAAGMSPSHTTLQRPLAAWSPGPGSGRGPTQARGSCCPREPCGTSNPSTTQAEATGCDGPRRPKVTRLKSLATEGSAVANSLKEPK